LPRVTVVTATYNWSEVLPYAIGSVLDQTFTDFELMVVGDCCTDNSAEVVASFDDPRVSWLNLPVNSRHQSGPNNEAIRRSDSDLIAYLGHDDLWLPHHLELQVEAMTGVTGMSHGSALMVEPPKAPFAYPHDNWAYRAGDWMPPSAVVHSRSLANDVGGWRPPWQTGLRDPDPDMWARLTEAGGRPPIWVRDVTAIKLSAGARRDVYLTRPCHEQRFWLEQIRRGQTWTDLIDRSRLDRVAMSCRNAGYAVLPTSVRSWGTRRRKHQPGWLTRQTAEQRWLKLRESKGVDRGN
jgi:glycosyltransferase involved in cell wall biosynthesis